MPAQSDDFDNEYDENGADEDDGDDEDGQSAPLPYCCILHVSLQGDSNRRPWPVLTS